MRNEWKRYTGFIFCGYTDSTSCYFVFVASHVRCPVYNTIAFLQFCYDVSKYDGISVAHQNVTVTNIMLSSGGSVRTILWSAAKTRPQSKFKIYNIVTRMPPNRSELFTFVGRHVAAPKSNTVLCLSTKRRKRHFCHRINGWP